MANIDASTPQLKVVKEWVDAITSLNISKVIPHISKDFTYQSLPHATELLEIRDQARDAHLSWLKGLMALCTKSECIVHEVIEAPGKVVVHATFPITLIDGITYDYDTLTIFSLVEEEGETKVLNCKDFSDPHKRGTFYAGVAKAAPGMPAS